MGAAENKQLIETMFAELSRGNGAGYLERLADDVQFTIIGSTKFSGTFDGKQDVVNRLLMPRTLAATPVRCSRSGAQDTCSSSLTGANFIRGVILLVLQTPANRAQRTTR